MTLPRPLVLLDVDGVLNLGLFMSSRERGRHPAQKIIESLKARAPFAVDDDGTERP
jgi:hypothetical protein